MNFTIKYLKQNNVELLSMNSREILGRARAKKGMFEGDMKEGELEIGQVASMINHVKPARKIMDELLQEFRTAKTRSF